jgi:hypothetical protein
MNKQNESISALKEEYERQVQELTNILNGNEKGLDKKRCVDRREIFKTIVKDLEELLK